MATHRPSLRLLMYLAVALVLGLTILGLSWRYFVTPHFTQRLSQRIGHRVTLTNLSWTWGLALKAKGVQIAGAPPFDHEPLAVIDQVLVRLRGPEGFTSPSEIWVDGLELSLLGTTTANNLRGKPGAPKPKARGKDERVSPKQLPPIHVRSGRIVGHFALGPSHRVTVRSGSFQVQAKRDGFFQAALQDLTLEVQNQVTVRIPSATVSANPQQPLMVRADAASLQIPHQGDFLNPISLLLQIGDQKVTAEVRSTLGTDGPPLVTFSADRALQMGNLTLHLKEVALGPLSAAFPKSLGLAKAKLNLDLQAQFHRAQGTASFTLAADLVGFDVDHPSWDRIPWQGLSLASRWVGTIDLATRHLRLTEGNLRAFGLSLNVGGHLALEPSLHGELTLEARPKEQPPCAALLALQPLPLQKALAGLELEGRLGFRLATQWDANVWENLNLAVDIAPLCRTTSEPFAIAQLLPSLVKATHPQPPEMTLPLGFSHPDFVPLARMPRHLRDAFVTAEDGKFYRHRGFDLDMIQSALIQDLESQSISRGASTITQQLAKNLFLTHHRTLARKLAEAIFAWRLNQVISKDRTLELYLNIIELGPGIQGVGKAAKTYFGKPPSDLTLLESAHMAALTPNPHVLARRFQDGQVDEGWLQRLYDLLGMMQRSGRLTKEEVAKARNGGFELRPILRDSSR